MSCDVEHDYHSFWYALEAIKELINRRVEEALAAYEATRAANALEAESQSQNGSDGDNRNGGNGNGGNGNPKENNIGARPVARECTYQDFMKCQPLNFKGTEGVVGLIRWFEKMETLFHISNCPERYQDQFLYDKPTEDDQEKSKVREESDSTIPDPSHQTVTSTPPVIAPFTDVSSTKPSSLVTTPSINTEATTITTSSLS
ncbi:hypothetical protein Tco_0788732 [Tanacetum coccineum]